MVDGNLFLGDVMADKAILLDRDNTILEDKEGYLGDPAKVKLLPGAATAIAAMRRLGFRIIVVSNQSGVARGMFDEAAVEAVNQEMCKQLREQAGASVDASYYCPFLPDAKVPEYRQDHPWRKPKPGMLQQAAEDFTLDLTQSWMIGDTPRDIEAGAAVGCRTILIRDPDHMDREGRKPLTVQPNFICKNLTEAARIVSREGAARPMASAPASNAAERPAETPARAAAEPAPVSAPVAVPAVPMSAVASGALPAEVASREVSRPASAPAETAPVAVPLGASADAAPSVRVTAPEGAARPSESVQSMLEAILAQLRQANRLQDMPEFNLARMLAVLVQVLAAVCLLMTAVTALTYPKGDEYYTWNRMVILMTAGVWGLGAVALQGMTIALLMQSRRR